MLIALWKSLEKGSREEYLIETTLSFIFIAIFSHINATENVWKSKFYCLLF
jgi:hypothetical protein